MTKGLKQEIQRLVATHGKNEVWNIVNSITKRIGRRAKHEEENGEVIVAAAYYASMGDPMGTALGKAYKHKTGKLWDDYDSQKRRLLKVVHDHVLPEDFDDWAALDDAVQCLRFNKDAVRREKAFEEYLNKISQNGV